jgi:hypothetical protein
MNDKPIPASEERTDLERFDDLVDHFYGDHQRVRSDVRTIGLDVAEAMAAGHPVYIASEEHGLLFYHSTDDGWETEKEFGCSDVEVFNSKSGISSLQTMVDILRTRTEVLENTVEIMETRLSLEENHNKTIDELWEKDKKSEEKHRKWMLNHQKKIDIRGSLILGILIGLGIAILLMAVLDLTFPVKENVGVDRSARLSYTIPDVDQTHIHYSRKPQRLIGRDPIKSRWGNSAAFVVLRVKRW